MRYVKCIGDLYVDNIGDWLEMRIIQETKSLRCRLGKKETEELLKSAIEYLIEKYKKHITNCENLTRDLIKDVQEVKGYLEKHTGLTQSARLYYMDRIKNLEEKIETYKTRKRKLELRIKTLEEVYKTLTEKEGSVNE